MNGIREVLLTSGLFSGTLAAARYFGRQGHRVVLADDHPRSPTAASRFVSRFVTCPALIDFRAILRWLLDYGRRHPGTLLYPCSDDHAWLYARHREELSQSFAMFQPALPVIETLLDKERLYRTCERLGIPTPHTLYPTCLPEMRGLVKQLAGDFLVKPKTQVGISLARKAVLAPAGQALVRAYEEFRSSVTYSHEIAQHSAQLTWPMLQQFHHEAATQTISVAGFCGDGDGPFHAVFSRKALQYPLNIGIGLCFESLPPLPALAERVRALCKAVGYHGVFEVEFVSSGNEFLLMDFNPRFYGQMQLEIGRGLPLPGLVAASLDRRPLDVSIDPAKQWRFGNRALLKLVATTQWLGGRISRQKRTEWIALHQAADRRWIDQMHDRDDPRPAAADRALRGRSYLRHPRSSFRNLFRDA